MSGSGAFSDLGSGASADAGGVSLSTAQVGDYSETVVLSPVDTNASGFSEMLPQETITVLGTITRKARRKATCTW